VLSPATKNTAARHRDLLRPAGLPVLTRSRIRAVSLEVTPGSSFVDVRLSTHSGPTPPRSRGSSPPVRSHRPPSRSRPQVGRGGARCARSLWRYRSATTGRPRARRRSRSQGWGVMAPLLRPGRGPPGEPGGVRRRLRRRSAPAPSSTGWPGTTTPCGRRLENRSSPGRRAGRGSTTERSGQRFPRPGAASGRGRRPSGGLVAGPERSRFLEPGDESADRLVVGRDRVDHRPGRARLGPRSRDGVLLDVHCEDVEVRGIRSALSSVSFVCVSVRCLGPLSRSAVSVRCLGPLSRSAASWWATHARCGTSRPFHPH